VLAHTPFKHDQTCGRCRNLNVVVGGGIVPFAIGAGVRPVVALEAAAVTGVVGNGVGAGTAGVRAWTTMGAAS
jgi:hypothetical protein